MPSTLLSYLCWSLGLAFGYILVLCVVQITLVVSRTSSVPPEIPWVGLKGKTWFPKIRACYRDLTAGRAPAEEGWEKYGKAGKPFIIPQLHRPEIVLPPSSVAWVMKQPDHIVSGIKTQDDLLGLTYFAQGPNNAAVHDFGVIRRDLTRQLGRILPDMLDEIDASFTEILGTDTEEWQEMAISPRLTTTTHRSVDRIFVGLPLCRSDGFHKSNFAWAVAFAICGALHRYLTPHLLQPVVGPLLWVPLSILKYFAVRRILPEVRRRIKKLEARSRPTSEKEGDSDNVDALDAPADMMQWLIQNAARDPSPGALSPWNVAGKLILDRLFAMHTTSLTAGTVIFDILSCDSAAELMAELREEAEAILPDLATNPRRVRDMWKLDSVIRETLRLHPLFGHGSFREVVAPGGITTPEGLFLPQGSCVCALVAQVQREKAGEDGAVYRPLRFYEEAQLNPDKRQTPAVQIGDKLIGFSLGAHSCPGRFFAVQTVKLMIAKLMRDYDFKPLAERPRFREIASAAEPPPKAKVTLRRRKVEA